jgi:hypothetical protein
LAIVPLNCQEQWQVVNLAKGKKSLQKDSAFEEFDMDGDGIVSDEEIAAVKTIHEVEGAEEKADAQRQMAWTSLIVMIVFTGLVFLPIFPDSRIKALADLFGLFYIGMAGVVGAYMGMTAWMANKK